MAQEYIEADCTLNDLIRETLDTPDGAIAFLTQSWIGGALGLMRQARRNAGLTQREVAERLHTTQSAIARMEHDRGGGVSLRRFANYIAACGYMPREVSLDRLDSARGAAHAEFDVAAPSPTLEAAAHGDDVRPRFTLEPVPIGAPSTRSEMARHAGGA